MKTNLDPMLKAGLAILLAALAPLALSAQSPAPAQTAWVDDALPAGASELPSSGDPTPWNWVSSNPPPFSGTRAHQSANVSGEHYHAFSYADATLSVNNGDVLTAYVFLDPDNPPGEVMLSWCDSDGSWEHRAYWGANSINYGTDGTASRRYMGPLPAAGQWKRLEVPANLVGLEGATLQGVSFGLYATGNSRATWDLAGKSAGFDLSDGPNSSSSGDVDYVNLRVPAPGDHTLHVLSPNLLELVLINTKQPNPARVDSWDWVDANGNFIPPDVSRITVKVNGQPVGITLTGFKRRPLYAPLHTFHDLRIANHLYLQLNGSIAAGQSVQVVNDGTQWPSGLEFTAVADPLRYSPAIHVNQEGYVPSHPKKAMVGYYLGSRGEMAIPSTSFSLVDARSGSAVYTGTLTLRRDTGYVYTPTPYQNVYEADFSSFTTPGEYCLMVPGMGASLPFMIDDGIAMGFARTYALGLFHQRSGYHVAMPFTRFTHAADHTAPALVPVNDAAPYAFTWQTIANYATQVNSDNPPQIAPRLTSPAAQLYPFVNPGPVDASGGHFEAANYSRVTWNAAQAVHVLMLTVDALLPQNGTALDNLGLPESGDGISDVLQEAKWEADFLLKMQDADGGFYYTTYPINREYENNVLPEDGDQEVVWPKNTVATAAAVAALAQCASSPRFKQAYPQAANTCWVAAQRGWQFLTNAIAQHGLDGAYQKIQHFGDYFTDRDELAWAACELFLATGDPQYQAALQAWFPDPADPATFRWGWWRMYACYGNTIRSYAYAVRSGRLPASQLDQNYLARCLTVITDCANDNLRWSQESAYGSSFPDATKRVRGAGWYFSTVQAFDIVVAQELDPNPVWLDAIVGNLNYEAGNNPVNATYLTGLGWKRQREVVDQYSANDRHVLPKTGIPIGNIQEGFVWTFTYGGELTALCFPSDGVATAPHPFYDRWGDFWNVTTEASTTDTVRCFATTAWLAAQTQSASQPWRFANAVITASSNNSPGQPMTVSVQVPGLDLGGARVVWEAQAQEPAYGDTFTFTPSVQGDQWVEVEVQWPDGRRAFGVTNLFADNGLPTVTITSADATMTEGSADTASFTLTRTGNMAGDLTVTLQPSGSATKWNDYRRQAQGDMPDDWTIPDGASSITITIMAAEDAEAEGTETAQLTILPRASYNIGSPSATTLMIVDNDG